MSLSSSSFGKVWNERSSLLSFRLVQPKAQQWSWAGILEVRTDIATAAGLSWATSRSQAQHRNNTSPSNFFLLRLANSNHTNNSFIWLHAWENTPLTTPPAPTRTAVGDGMRTHAKTVVLQCSMCQRMLHACTCTCTCIWRYAPSRTFTIFVQMVYSENELWLRSMRSSTFISTIDAGRDDRRLWASRSSCIEATEAHTSDKCLHHNCKSTNK